MRTEQDFRNQLAYARQEGRKEGMEKGMEKGIRQASVEMARRMLSDGMDKETVSKYSGVTIEELGKML